MARVAYWAITPQRELPGVSYPLKKRFFVVVCNVTAVLRAIFAPLKNLKWNGARKVGVALLQGEDVAWIENDLAGSSSVLCGILLEQLQYQ